MSQQPGEELDKMYQDNWHCGLCDSLRKELEDAIKEEDRLITRLAAERRHHIEKAEDARRKKSQVD